MDRKNTAGETALLIILQMILGFVGMFIGWALLCDLMEKAQINHRPTMSALEWFEEEQSLKLNLIIKDADLGQVLVFMTREAGLNLVYIEPNPPILVSAKLTDVPWRRALRLILEPNGLTYRIEQKTLVILPAQLNSQ